LVQSAFATLRLASIGAGLSRAYIELDIEVRGIPYRSVASLLAQEAMQTKKTIAAPILK